MTAPTKWTPEQLQAIEAASQGLSFRLDAVAGSGKTTTGVEIVRHLPSRNPLVLAFNVSIKKEFEQRLAQLGTPATCLTLNGLGHRALTGTLGRVRLDADKLAKLLTQYCKDQDLNDGDAWKDLRLLVERARTHGVVVDPPRGSRPKPLSPDTPEFWEDMAREVDADPKLIHHARKILARSTLMAFSGEIDFTDQIYVPVCFRFPFPRYPAIVVDEAQDLSAMNHIQLERTLAPEGQLVAIGDPNQAIYAFRGALSESMDRLTQQFKLEHRPLSCSFRCPKSVVELAQAIVPHITSAPDAPEGEIQEWTTWDATQLPNGAHVVCRNNGPILSLAFKLLARGRGARVLGREIGEGLIKLIKKLAPGDSFTRWNMEELAQALESWRVRETAALEALGKTSAAEIVRDRAEALGACIVASDAATPKALGEAIRRLFSAESAPISLSTIHKAKGLEWNFVLFLDPWRIPSRFAKEAESRGDPGPMRQEMNLRYVAQTRAKRVLAHASMDDFEKEPSNG